MKYNCELLKNKELRVFIIKLFFLLLQKLKELKIPDISSFFAIHFTSFYKEKIVEQNGLECGKICEELVAIDNYKEFHKKIDDHEITTMQMTGIMYSISSKELIYRTAILHSSSLSKEVISIYNELFGERVKDIKEIEKITLKSEGDWFLPLIYIYGKRVRTNIVTASLNYDKVYVRESLGYSRPVTKKDIRVHTLKGCMKSQFHHKKVVLGDSFFKVVKNGIFENVMKKHNQEIISGFSGSCIMVYNFIFNILELLPKTKHNEIMLLLMLLLDFYPLHHSISETLVTYTRESKHLKKYYLDQNVFTYLKQYTKKRR